MAATYIDISVLEDVSPFLLAGEPALVWSEQLDAVLWANAAGVELLGAATLGDVLSQDYSYADSQSPAGLILAELHKQGESAASTESFPLQLDANAEFNVVALPIEIDSEQDAVLTVLYGGKSADKSESLSKRAGKLAALFADQPGCAAVLDKKFDVLASGGGMMVSQFSSVDLYEINLALENTNLVKRLVSSDHGAHPAGLAKMSDGNCLLLIASEPVSAEADDTQNDNQATLAEDVQDDATDELTTSSNIDYQASHSEVDIADMARIRAALQGEGRKNSQKVFQSNEGEITYEPNVEMKSQSETDERSFFQGKDYWYLKAQDKETPQSEVGDITTALEDNESDEIETAPAELQSENAIEREVEPDEQNDQAEPEITAPPVFAKSTKNHSTRKAGASKIPTVKFAFNTDAESTIVNVSPELETQVGRHFANIRGMKWPDVAEQFGFDTDGEITQCLQGTETWSGKTVLWPVSGTNTHVPVDLSALPHFSKRDGFKGFRGFGAIRVADTAEDPNTRGLLKVTRPATNNDKPLVVPDSKADHQFDKPPITSEIIEPSDTEADQSIDKAAHNAVPVFAPNDSSGLDMLARKSVEVFAPKRRKADAERRIELVEDLYLGDEDLQEASPTPAEPAQDTSGPIASDSFEAKSDLVSEQDEQSSQKSEDDAQTMEQIAQHLLNSELSDEIEPSSDADAPEENAVATLVSDEQDRDLEDALSAVEQLSAPEYQDIQVQGIKDESNAFEISQSTLSTKALSAEILHLADSDEASLCYFNDELLFANQALLDLSGYEDLDDLSLAGGLDSLLASNEDHAQDHMALTAKTGEELPVIANLRSVSLPSEASLDPDIPKPKALIITFVPIAIEDKNSEDGNDVSVISPPQLSGEDDLSATLKLGLSVQQLHDVLETATDGVVVLNSNGEIHALNSSAEALFGFNSEAVYGQPFASLFASDWQAEAEDYFASIKGGGVGAVLNDGRELTGFEVSGGFIPMFVTLGRLAGRQQGVAGGYCAVLRDLTQWKRVESELVEARKQAEKANDEKSEFLARISHEIRTPLNAIIGFSEIIAGERFGPLGNARYREYVRDINSSGSHVLQLVNDLLDISKIEAGAWELQSATIDMNSVVASTVSIMQAEAGQARVLMRTSLSNSVPFIEADETAFRQIVLNLLSNAVKFTGEGGQVIISTAVMNNGEVELRIRDTGKGMNLKEIEEAMQPYRQLSTTAPANGAKGTGLGLPLTKALAEANGAEFSIYSEVDQGTWVVVAFPKERVSLPNHPGS